MEPGEGARKLTPAEASFVEGLRKRGIDVEIVPEGGGRTPDFRINGVPTELKTLSGVANETPDGLSSALSSRILDGRGQSKVILVDARRQSGMTLETAQRGINRAVGADNQTGRKVEAITVLTTYGTVRFQR